MPTPATLGTAAVAKDEAERSNPIEAAEAHLTAAIMLLGNAYETARADTRTDGLDRRAAAKTYLRARKLAEQAREELL